MTDTKKRKAIYDPEAQKRWKEKNRARSNYLSYRGTARTFIRNHATPEDIEELQQLMVERLEKLKAEVAE